MIASWNDDGVLIDILKADMPVIGVSHEAAEAYCRWFGRRKGVMCRLPTAFEWEKAARGTDGRQYIWGERFISGMALTLDHFGADASSYLPAVCGSFDKDVSIYGVKDLGGNAREWTSTPDPLQPNKYLIKGCGILTEPRALPCAYSEPGNPLSLDSGFRYVVELSWDGPAN